MRIEKLGVTFKSWENVDDPFSQFRKHSFPSMTYDSFKYTHSEISKNDTKNNKLLKAGVITGACLIGVAGVYKLVKRPTKPNEFAELRQIYSNITERFPKDKDYYTTLTQNIGLKKGEEFRLTSIVGQEQLTSLLKTYTKEDFMNGENLEGVRNLTYRVNLHNHTQASDGKLTVAEFLEQARKWADRIAQKSPKSDGKPAFTIAITDHDTLDGAQEAVRIIANDPLKYKNLRVVLGSEISVSHLGKAEVQKPLNFELIGYGLNPFGKHMNELFDTIGKGRSKAMEKFISDTHKEFPQYNLNIEDTKIFHPNLAKVRTNGILYLTKDYLKFKMLLSDYTKAINEKLIQDSSKQLNADTLFKELSSDYYYRMDAQGIKDMSLYFKEYGLKTKLQKSGILTPENEQKYYEIFNQDFSQKDKFLKKLLNKSLPTVDDKKGYILSPNEVFDAARKDGSTGFFGFAHPGFIRPEGDAYSESMKQYCMHSEYCNSWEYPVFRNLLLKLRNENPDLFKAAEVNYQSYGKLKDTPEQQNAWLNFIRNLTEENEMLKTGGVDCHKPSIFKKHKNLTKDEINSCNLVDIIGS